MHDDSKQEVLGFATLRMYFESKIGNLIFVYIPIKIMCPLLKTKISKVKWQKSC